MSPLPGFGGTSHSSEFFVHFHYRGQHLRNECADLTSQPNRFLGEVPVFEVAIALSLWGAAALSTSMHPAPPPAPNSWGSAGRP